MIKTRVVNKNLYDIEFRSRLNPGSTKNLAKTVSHRQLRTSPNPVHRLSTYDSAFHLKDLYKTNHQKLNVSSYIKSTIRDR